MSLRELSRENWKKLGSCAEKNYECEKICPVGRACMGIYQKKVFRDTKLGLARIDPIYVVQTFELDFCF